MQHQLGHVNIVAWQDRRLRDAQRPGAVSIALAATAVVSLLVLALRFVAGAPLPVELLQLAFALLLGSSAWLLMRAVANFILGLQRR